MTILVVQTIVCALSICPVLLVWIYLLPRAPSSDLGRVLVFSLMAPCSYAVFAATLMMVSALSIRALGWRTPPDAEMPIADMSWPLLRWAKYMAAIHVVRIFAGMLVRGTPIWTAYLRLCGARLGRRVFVNSLALSDYNLLEFGDDVVVGADAHIAGHTVEHGIVKTGRVRLGSRVTIGIGSIIEIGVEAAPGSQVGALSLVPKHARLEAGATYAGIPARRLDRPSSSPDRADTPSATGPR